MDTKEYIEDYLYYSDEVKQALQNVSYYLQHLMHTCEEPESQQLIDDAGTQINSIFQNILGEEDRLQQNVEDEKTDEDKKRDKNIEALRQAYYQATGDVLVLSTKDIMQSLHDDFNRIKSSTHATERDPNWNGIANAGWVDDVKSKLEAYKKKIRTN